MRIVTFASGSTGNCSLISDGKANILIDAGISMRRIVNSLAMLGLTPHDLCGVLITHEHSDHISGLKMLCKYHHLRIYAPEQLCSVLDDVVPEIKGYLCGIPENKYFDMDGISVKCFRTPHDSHYSVGYRLEGKSIIGYATDTGSITPQLLNGLEGSDLVLIEANHDVQMLQKGPYPYYLKQRILSSVGHLSNSDCAQLAKHLANGGTRYIIIGHLSRENNTREIAVETVGAELTGTKAQLFAAPMDTMLTVSVEENSECLV